MLRGLIRKLIYRENASSDTLVEYLRGRGASIGEDVTIYAPNKTVIDKTAPWLLKIGDHVRITEGVKILSHDYSWSVLKHYSSENVRSGGILGSQRAVEIGNNVFIGMNAVITCGVTVGDNVVIGAGSVVTKDCESDGVYAGVPAKRIMSIDEFYHKRKAAQFAEAKDIALRYKQALGIEPDKTVFSEYFMLFSTCDEAKKTQAFCRQMQTGMNEDETVSYMMSERPMFASFEDFLDACYGRSKE